MAVRSEAARGIDMLAFAEQGDNSALAHLIDAILHQPCCVVLSAMRREAERPGAASVLPAEVLTALRHPILRDLIK